LARATVACGAASRALVVLPVFRELLAGLVVVVLQKPTIDPNTL
jgi:hypothetical protein